MGFAPLDQLSELFAPLGVPWWVAGGLAVDAHVGKPTRWHADVDVLVLDRDLATVARRLPDAYAERPESGERLRWDRSTALVPGLEALALPVRFAGGISKLQILVGVSDGAEWVYHRGRGTLRLPLDDITRRTQGGVPYLAPIVTLLFKSRSLRDKDTADFRSLLPILDGDERRWLRRVIEPWRQDHPWLPDL